MGPTDSSVEVEFEDFHLEEAVNFCDDYIHVYEGFFVSVSESIKHLLKSDSIMNPFLSKLERVQIASIHLDQMELLIMNLKITIAIFLKFRWLIEH